MNEDDVSLDITRNLLSLQFESSLEEEEKVLLPLRNRSHAHLVHGCAHALYFVKCINEFRCIKNIVQNANKKRMAMRLMLELDMGEKDPMLIGIIGAGRIGSYIAELILEHITIFPGELKISTRRPETLKHFEERGVVCCNDNQRVASSVHLLFLCVLPSQLPGVAEELRDNLSPRTLVYSFVTGVTVAKMKQLLEHDNIIVPRWHWNDEESKSWPVDVRVNDVFQRNELLRQTFPLHTLLTPTEEKNAEKEGSTNQLLWCDPKLLTLWIYGLTNVSSSMGLTALQVIEVLNHVFLGASDNPEANVDELFRVEDLVRGLQDSKKFPPFDLCEISSRTTFLDRRIEDDSDLRTKLTRRYMTVFFEFFKWQKFK